MTTPIFGDIVPSSTPHLGKKVIFAFSPLYAVYREKLPAPVPFTFFIPRMSNKPSSTFDFFTSWTELHENEEVQTSCERSDIMSNRPDRTMDSSSNSNQSLDVSATQRMLSAVTGSLVTSLLVTPLDVVRVRLQSQVNNTPPTAARPSSFLPGVSFGGSSNVGVTACCREVFWVSNDAHLCLASPQSGLHHTNIKAPVQTISPSMVNCAVEETQQKGFTSTLDGLQKIARNEGPRSLWRGLSPTLLMAIPGNVIYFAGYDSLRYSDKSPLKNRISDRYAPLVAGSIARVAAAAVVSPIEMLRTRMQAASGSTQGLFTGTVNGLRDMVKAQGPASLWRGLTLTMWRDVPFSGFYWWGYESMRDILSEARHEARGRRNNVRSDKRRRSRSQENYTATFVDSTIAGAVSGAIAALVTTPFDVGKTRQQVVMHADDIGVEESFKETTARASKLGRAVIPEERIMPRFLYHIWKTEGLPGLFRGWAARCLKVAPACAIMISSYEIGKKMALDVNERRD